MSYSVKNLPIAISGLLLAILSLGNIFTIDYIKSIVFIIGLIIILLLLSKCILYKEVVINELNQMIVLSTSGTFSMALMLFSTYLIYFSYQMSLVIWLAAILLHIMLILIFTYRYILNDFNIEQVYASYWIVYVGITMASITGLSFDLQWVTWIFCVFGFVMMFITFPIVTYRYLKYPVKQEANKPLICIYAAIFNILIVGYVNSFSTINYTFLLLLYIIATLCYLFSLYKFITYRKMPFYPSFSAFTFPFVISAIASLKINDLFNNSVIEYLLYFECTVAAILVIYVLIRYSYNYLTNEQ